MKSKSPWVFCVLSESLIPQGRKQSKQKKVCFHTAKPKCLQFWFKTSRGSRLLFNVTWGQCRWVDKYTNRFFFSSPYREHLFLSVGLMSACVVCLELPQSARGPVTASTRAHGGFRCLSHIFHWCSSVSASNSQHQWDFVLVLPPFLAACTGSPVTLLMLFASLRHPWQRLQHPKGSTNSICSSWGKQQSTPLVPWGFINTFPTKGSL